MSVKCSAIMQQMEKLAPLYLAEAWDNVGLLLGDPEQDIDKVIVTLDVDQQIVNEAIAAGANMIIAHHPLLFKGVTRIRTDWPQGRILAALIKAQIAVYAAHTNLDSAPGGVNDVLAHKLNLIAVEPLTTAYQDSLHKLAVFVPATHTEQVRQAMTEAGAGSIGMYSHCTFMTRGTGTFLPSAAAKPFIGDKGRLEFVDEYRLETVIQASKRLSVINAMLAAHPYEEVAYDEYLLLNKGTTYGLGRVGRLAVPLPLADVVNQIKTALNIKALKVAARTSADLIHKVAVCGGSGAGLIKNAISAGADLLITGDVKYHEAQQAVAEGLTVIDAGHFATEQPVVANVVAYLKDCADKNGWSLPIISRSRNYDIFTLC